LAAKPESAFDLGSRGLLDSRLGCLAKPAATA